MISCFSLVCFPYIEKLCQNELDIYKVWHRCHQEVVDFSFLIEFGRGSILQGICDPFVSSAQLVQC